MNTKTPERPEAVFVAGPNGSGKSTAVDGYIRKRFSELPYLSADALVAEWLVREPRRAECLAAMQLEAAKKIDAEVARMAAAGTSFVVETVLSSGKYRPLVNLARASGLIFRLVYVTTEDPTLNVERVRQRVASGGHDVPEDRVRARWDRSMAELPWFAERADRLLVVDNSGPEPVPLALRSLEGPIEFKGERPDHPALRKLDGLRGTSAVPPKVP